MGFYEPKIDEIIDFKLGHDSSRYDADKLAEAGLKQLILHHYLDRIQDLMISYKAEGVKNPKEFEFDERNIFNLIAYPPDLLEKATYDIYSRIPSGKSRRSKRREARKKLKEIYEGLKEHQELMCLKPLVREVIQMVENNFEFIMKCIEQDKRTDKRAIKAKLLGQVAGEMMSKLSYEYRRKRMLFP